MGYLSDRSLKGRSPGKKHRRAPNDSIASHRGLLSGRSLESSAYATKHVKKFPQKCMTWFVAFLTLSLKTYLLTLTMYMIYVYICMIICRVYIYVHIIQWIKTRICYGSFCCSYRPLGPPTRPPIRRLGFLLFRLLEVPGGPATKRQNSERCFLVGKTCIWIIRKKIHMFM